MNCRIASRSGRASGSRHASAPGLRRAPATSSSTTMRRVARLGLDRTAPAGGRSAGARRRPWRMRARVWSTNSSIEPMRIGSGSTIDGGAGQPAGLDGGDQVAGGGPEDGHVVAGLRRPGAAASAPSPLASSWSSAQGDRTSLVAVDEGDRRRRSASGVASEAGRMDGTAAPRAGASPGGRACRCGTTTSDGGDVGAGEYLRWQRTSPALGTTRARRTATRGARGRDRGAWQDRWDEEDTFEAPNPAGLLGELEPWPTGPSCTCWTCSRTRRAPGCTSATRWATSAPTSTPATSA